MQHLIDQFAETIRVAGSRRAALHIRAGGTKDFYGNSTTTVRDASENEILDPSSFAGLVDYEPTELVVTARSGMGLADLEAVLYERGQMLPFEPPHFGSGATLGGCVASGLSGPRRASAGAVRDFVLGIRMLDGKADDMRFGGQVMKNVAGYDISRLLTGSMGTLGLLLEISLKVLPLPPRELTLRFRMSEHEAIRKMNEWAGRPLSISATCFTNGELAVRLSGADPAVRLARQKLGGEEIAEGPSFWASVREQAHPFFQTGRPLWRLSIKSTTPPLSLPGKQLIEWGGALRWLMVDEEVDQESVRSAVRQAAESGGGHATLFRSAGSRSNVFHPLSPSVARITQRLKEKFDPHHILNPGRMYSQI
jgi:glycolate oxidase FAD binding subunit